MVLAGGQSSRFGGDKALARWRGRPLIAHAVEALSRHCREVVIAGRESGPARCIADWPGPGMGPLGGIAAGLRHAREHGFASVLTCGVDSPGLDGGVLECLSPPPCYLADQPVIGHWPVSAANAAETILGAKGRHSMKAFARAIGARAVKSGRKAANINTQADLAAMEIDDGL